MHIKIDQPDRETERKILRLVRNENKIACGTDTECWEDKGQKEPKIMIKDIIEARSSVYDVHMSEAIEEYLVQLIMATRHPEKYDTELKGMILYGASPRATIALDRCARINAWIDGRDFVTPEDIHAVLYDILRHRIILSFEAQAEGITTDDVIQKIVQNVPLP